LRRVALSRQPAAGAGSRLRRPALAVLSRRREAAPLAAAHLEQTVSASVWAGVLLIGVNGAILLVGGYDGPNVWTVVIVYFTVFHSTLVVLGILASPRRWPGSAGATRWWAAVAGGCRRD